MYNQRTGRLFAVKIFGNGSACMKADIIDLFYKLPQVYGELSDFREALKNGKF